MGAVGLFVTHYLETNFTLWGSQLASDCQENMHLCWYRFPQNEYDVIKTINVDNLFFSKSNQLWGKALLCFCTVYFSGQYCLSMFAQNTKLLVHILEN